MVDPIFNSDTYQIARKLMDAAMLRQTAIASNIANAETPGYKRLDVASDFATQLRNSVEGTGAGSTADISSLTPQLVKDTNTRSTRPDGNNVETDSELLAMNKNTVEYDYLTEVVSYNLKQLRMAVSGNPS
jgi:flagellar basal-body rod protein FlgB